MEFSNKIYRYLEKSGVLAVGEVKIHQAYLYGGGYEIWVHALENRKVVNMEIREIKNNRKLVLSKVGTVSNVLNTASGYIRNH